MHNVLLNLQFEIELDEKLLQSYPQHSEVLRAGDGDFGTKNKLEKVIHHAKIYFVILGRYIYICTTPQHRHYDSI